MDYLIYIKGIVEPQRVHSLEEVSEFTGYELVCLEDLLKTASGPVVVGDCRIEAVPSESDGNEYTKMDFIRKFGHGNYALWSALHERYGRKGN